MTLNVPLTTPADPSRSLRMTINVSLIMTADFAWLGTFYHSPFIFRGNAIKKNRSESVPDGHKSDGIQVFQNFSKNTLEDFHIRIRYALVETSVQGDGFFAADFFHFFCPVGKEEAVFPCIFFYPLFAYEALLIMVRTMTVIVGLVRWR